MMMKSLIEPSRITVLWTRISDRDLNMLQESSLGLLPPECYQDVSSYEQPLDRGTRLAARLLLNHGLVQRGLPRDLMKGWRLDSALRPSLSQSLDFNISHSGEYVVVALTTDGRVGIDFEITQPIPPWEVLEIFSDKVAAQVMESPSPELEFYKLWTKVEAALKAHGQGLLIDPSLLEISSSRVVVEEVPYTMQTFNIDSHYCSLAHSHSSVNPSVAYIPVQELFAQPAIAPSFSSTHSAFFPTSESL